MSETEIAIKEVESARSGFIEPEGLVASLDEQCQQLMLRHRDPDSAALAQQITDTYRELDQSDRIRFMMLLNNNYDVDPDAIISAAREYERSPGFDSHQLLARVIEAPRQKLFSCINTAPDGLQTLILMRQDLLSFDIPIRKALTAVESDLKNLLQSWFNRGFLQLERIDWQSSASLLEKLIEYEAVHQIHSWDDLRRRLQDDRRCFAYFHPSMKTEPLVFVEVALTDGIAERIESLIEHDAEVTDPTDANTAMFYSISSCQPGLTGISFGGLLIKRVVKELQADLPGINTFSTLSPVPGFSSWLSQQDTSRWNELKPLLEKMRADKTSGNELTLDAELVAPHRELLMSLLADYLLNAKLLGRPIDSVARFHLGNGAELRAIHWEADPSANGLSKSFSMMVNYVYQTDQIQTNRQNFLQHRIIAAHPAIHALAQRVKGN